MNLDYIVQKRALLEHVKDEDKKSLKELGPSAGPNYHEGKAVYINESRLYCSKKGFANI